MRIYMCLFITGFSSFFIGFFTYLAITEGYLNIGIGAAKAKQQCESTLPRDQHCEVIIKAIPVEEE